MTLRMKRQCSEFLSSDLNALDESASKVEDLNAKGRKHYRLDEHLKAQKLELSKLRQNLKSIRQKLEERERKKEDGKKQVKYLNVWRTAIKNTRKADANSGTTLTPLKKGTKFDDDVVREDKRLKSVAAHSLSL